MACYPQDGITTAVIGAISGAVVVIAMRSIIDIPTVPIAIAAVLTLLYVMKVQEPMVVVVAAFIGIALRMLTGT